MVTNKLRFESAIIPILMTCSRFLKIPVCFLVTHIELNEPEIWFVQLNIVYDHVGWPKDV
jgi:hypothetical protein